MDFKAIREDIIDYTGEDNIFYKETALTGSEALTEKVFDVPPLPGECANLRDEIQMTYHKENFAVKIALSVCEERRLFTALYAPKTYFICLKDYFHGRRLIIPYYDDYGKVGSYISRKIMEGDSKAKYLIKVNSDKPVFNLHRVDPLYPYIFVFEGALDAIFVKNGVAITGVSMTDSQSLAIRSAFPFHTIIWCFDNHRMEKDEVVRKIKDKIKEGERVFLYNNEFAKTKDIGEYCATNGLDYVDTERILENSHVGNLCLMRM